MAQPGTHEFSEGKSLSFLIHGLFTGLGALALFYINIVLGLILMGIAVLFVLVETGVEVQLEEERVRSYRALLGKKIGMWTVISGSAMVQLRHLNESQKMASRGTEQTVRTKTYTLILKRPEGEIKIHEFTDYALARKTLTYIAQEFSLASADDYAEKRKRISSARKGRRR